jgi:hypothetical protein
MSELDPNEENAQMKKMGVLGPHFLEHLFDAEICCASSAAPKREVRERR